jgi:hypothetical protein
MNDELEGIWKEGLWLNGGTLSVFPGGKEENHENPQSG